MNIDQLLDSRNVIEDDSELRAAVLEQVNEAGLGAETLYEAVDWADEAEAVDRLRRMLKSIAVLEVISAAQESYMEASDGEVALLEAQAAARDAHLASLKERNAALERELDQVKQELAQLHAH